MSFSPTDVSYFLQVVQQGHVGRAAASAGVTQPAISKAIHRLEAAIGVTLFERGAHGVRLTSDGHLFLESAQRFDAQHAELMRSAAELRAQHAGLLRVGLTNPASDSIPVQALSEMVRRRPGLRLVLSIGKSDALNDAVGKGELDLAVVPAYPGFSFSCSQIEIGEDRARVAARADHPLSRMPTLGLDALVGYTWALSSRSSASRRLLAQVFERAGLPAPRVAVEAEYTSDAIMGLLAGTDMLGLVPSSVLRGWTGRVNALPMPVLEVRRSLVLLTRPQAIWSPLMMALRDLLLSYRTS